jgi:electron transfer flavoprotein alpha/beta subunit
VNEAPIPGLKAVLDAGKKRSTEFKLQDIGLTDADVAPRTEVRDFKAYIMNRKNIIISADTNADKVKELVANLRKDGVI